jgi:segregation and condensation protein B
VRVAGRREVPGRPVVYATTPDFLAHFGLASLKELPRLDEMRAAGLLDPVDDEMIEDATQREADAPPDD